MFIQTHIHDSWLLGSSDIKRFQAISVRHNLERQLGDFQAESGTFSKMSRTLTQNQRLRGPAAILFISRDTFSDSYG